MTRKVRPSLIRFGPARSRTRADMEQGVPELIPTSLWKISGWSR